MSVETETTSHEDLTKMNLSNFIRGGSILDHIPQ